MLTMNWFSEHYLTTPEDKGSNSQVWQFGGTGGGIGECFFVCFFFLLFFFFFVHEWLQLENESDSKRNNPTRSL